MLLQAEWAFSALVDPYSHNILLTKTTSWYNNKNPASCMLQPKILNFHTNDDYKKQFKLQLFCKIQHTFKRMMSISEYFIPLTSIGTSWSMWGPRTSLHTFCSASDSQNSQDSRATVSSSSCVRSIMYCRSTIIFSTKARNLNADYRNKLCM